MTLSDPILVALDAQVACYRRLAKLADQQHEYVQQGQAEELLRILQLRQAELDQLTAHARVIAPAKQQWAAYLAKLLPAAKQRAESLMAETKTLLKRITDADKDDVLALQQRKLNIGRQIGQATAAKTVNRAYATAAYGGARAARVNVKS